MEKPLLREIFLYFFSFGTTNGERENFSFNFNFFSPLEKLSVLLSLSSSLSSSFVAIVASILCLVLNPT